ncbi:shikimate dehydrogenase [Ruminococcus sp.]|uniref:shikimate dehydrogenase family protein n=1 Tax=Ruminococcus sp. TaxID=41978 RepID=UPI0025FEDFBA|nr:shikimate dehydrogenase [Ruminococcus sp.]MBQ8966342.1 shikimate dehydrogenase [Ruminococcus sp.]
MERKYALLGESLKHTMSPPIHTRLFELKGREFSYEIIELPPEQLEPHAGYLKSLAGFNITIPHKMGIIPHCDKLAESAKRYNSVNCVDNKDGVHTGYNTDCDGFLASVRAMGAELGGRVLLLGCGGVGRMMAIEAALAGAELYIAVLESDLPLAEQAKKEITAMKPDAAVNIVLTTKIDASLGYDLLMNATPVGMYPRVDNCPVSDEVIAASKAVFDVIYNPRETQLLKKAKAAGKKYCGGMAMLVWQAVKAHEIWDGDSYTNEEVQAIIEEMQQLVEKDFPAAK